MTLTIDKQRAQDDDKHKDKARHAEKTELKLAQIELVKLQRHVIESGLKILVIFEGRDAAGKDGAIRRITQHLSPRDVRVVALGAPTDHNLKAWYYKRYVAHLPDSGEIVLFNRSWYNRAGVEHVMKFCTKHDCEQFLDATPLFEELLAHAGISLVKYYLDISKDEQKKRLKDRRDDPLTGWKSSPIDDVAIKRWDDYTDARDTMLTRTHTIVSPWTVVRADNKAQARINIIRDLLARFEFPGKKHRSDVPDPKVLFQFREAEKTNGMLAN
jgi:polyphosphate kinase